MLDKLYATSAFEQDVASISGISQTRRAALAKMGIATIRDLVQHFPRRYVDMSALCSIEYAPLGQNCTIQGTIEKVTLKRPRPKFSLVEVAIVDDTGIMIATFFRQPWLAKSLKAGMRVSVAGAMEFNFGYRRMTMPYLDILEENAQAKAAIIPVHPATAKVSPALMRSFVLHALDIIEGIYDPLPLEIRKKYRLMSRYAAFRSMHFPMSLADAHQAKRRLAYEEIFFLQLHLLLDAHAQTSGEAPHIHIKNGPHTQALFEKIPFSLTSDQTQAIEDIQSNMASGTIMNHMLLGDVGTGKTLVAGFAIASAVDAHTQVLMMAPTEILAQQYETSLGALFDSVGIIYATLTGSTPKEKKDAISEKFSSGHIDVLFGTHALLESHVTGNDIGLVIIDEQHRFGVEQRKALVQKGKGTDVLSLTATPIPRSLALALYGDMSLSYLTQTPTGAPARTTHMLNWRDKGKAYDAIRVACDRGEQAFVVCPLVGTYGARNDDGVVIHDATSHVSKKDDALDEDDYTYIEDDTDMDKTTPAAAEAHAAFLQDKVFGSDYTIGLLHGKMSAAQKAETMDAFRAGGIDILVATTVIEVGIDVPNATTMVIEDADKFGLSQLHQLRGRVGRGQKPGSVYLVAATDNEDALARLNIMEQTNNGFDLAEFDLKTRREGDILGNKQHGASILKLVQVTRDGNMIEAARNDAKDFFEANKKNPSEAYKIVLQEM
ncbi:MAG: ATP-dependent DNA helicase RecG, partial [Eggerthellaceae bacterium]|nr:ATP-dependent DNA helicase RecG [Eggerthellaceae bacterium]